MDYLTVILDRLAANPAGGYQAKGAAATEPMALAAIALLAHDRAEAAGPLVEHLLELQQPDGSLGIDAANARPGWPTAWSIIAWQVAQQARETAPELQAAFERARRWLVVTQGEQIDSEPWDGHDLSLRGWPWVQGTHSWIEPTAMAVLALKSTGDSQTARCREAVNLLINRLIRSGGCNYGNTIIFGQTLRAHPQPSGLALLALAGESDIQGRIDRTIEYLQRELGPETTTASLAYGLLGLAAHGEYPRDAEVWLAAAADRTLARDPSSYKLALVALAALGPECPLAIPQERKPAVPAETTS